MQRSDDEFLEFDEIDEPEIAGEDFADPSNEEIDRIERVANALTEYESAVAERERAATDPHRRSA